MGEKSLENVKTEIILKTFKKNGITNALDSTEHNVLFEDIISDDELWDFDNNEDDIFVTEH